MKRTPWCFAFVATAVSALLPSACSTTITEPPPLGDCIPTGDAGCHNSGGGGGGSLGGGHVDAGQVDGAVTISDGGTCGQADLLISSSTQNLACVPCIVGIDAGSLGCCQSDSKCSGDPGCLAIVQCTLMMCSGNAATGACVEANCEQGPTATPASVQNYDDFGSCLALSCSPECPSFPIGTAGEL